MAIAVLSPSSLCHSSLCHSSLCHFSDRYLSQRRDGRIFHRVSQGKAPPGDCVRWRSPVSLYRAGKVTHVTRNRLGIRRPRLHHGSAPLSSELRAQAKTQAPPAPLPSTTSSGPSLDVQSLIDMVPEHVVENLEIDLPLYDATTCHHVDLLVVGAGPAGLAVAQQVSASGLQVCCIDPNPCSIWPNNYGVWLDEFEALGLDDCLDFVWPKAMVHLDDDTSAKYLDRPYGRVNRKQLKSKMLQKCIDNGVEFLVAKAEGVTHSEGSSQVACSGGASVEAAVVLDATGFSRRLVRHDEPFAPGYQAAWGILAEVESHPFELDKMLFMDWRDGHLALDPEMRRRNQELPTFLYAMPFSPTRVFLEETSLVARPAIPFPEIQARMALRLRHLGIKVTHIEEEEYCLIPMGGVLPTIPQRVLGIGGTAGMVHPATGYMVARTLSAAPQLADAIVSRLAGSKSKAASGTNGSVTAASPASLSGDKLSAELWDELWPCDRREQREFFWYGMEVLLKMDLGGTRRFFGAFFDLSPFHWQGFLSSRLYLAELIVFGLSLFAHASNYARVEIVWKGMGGLGALVTNVARLRLQKR